MLESEEYDTPSSGETERGGVRVWKGGQARQTDTENPKLSCQVSWEPFYPPVMPTIQSEQSG